MSWTTPGQGYFITETSQLEKDLKKLKRDDDIAQMDIVFSDEKEAKKMLSIAKSLTRRAGGGVSAEYYKDPKYGPIISIGHQDDAEVAGEYIEMNKIAMEIAKKTKDKKARAQDVQLDFDSDYASPSRPGTWAYPAK
jgi:hypothetical protein